MAAPTPVFVTVLLALTLVATPLASAWESPSVSFPASYVSDPPMSSHGFPPAAAPTAGGAPVLSARTGSALHTLPSASPPLSTSATSAGVEYSGKASIAQEVQVGLTVPDDLPPASDQYMVLLSVFDGAQSYDRIGFAAVNGTWGVYYSVAAACGTRLHAHPHAFPLTHGTRYTFRMEIDGGGLILFELLDAGARSLWQQTALTQGTYFEIWATLTCGSTVVPGFTETEDVYSASLGAPPYNFYFTNSSEDGRPETAWGGVASSSLLTTIVRNGSNVTLYNEPFLVSFAPGADATSLESTPLPQLVQRTVTVSVLNGTKGPVNLSTYARPGSWGFSAAPPSGSGSFVSRLNITIPGGVVPGTYLVGIEGSNGSMPPNRIVLTVVVLPGLDLNITALTLSGHADANETVRFILSGAGGAPPYTYTWSGLPSDCASGVAGASCRFVSAGSFPLNAGLSDALGYVRSQNATFLVRSDPVMSTAAPTVSGTPGRLLSLEASVAGGLPPYTTFWTGLPSGCGSVNATNLTCTPKGPGNYSVLVSTTDSTGFRTSLLLVVSVVAPPGVGFLSGNVVVLVVIAVTTVALGAGIIAVMALRRRTRRP